MVIEARAEAPLLPLRLFRLKTLAGSNAVGFLLGASFYGYIFIGTLYMQQVLGYSAMRTGLAWLIVGLTGVAMAGPAQLLVTRTSVRLVMAAGMTLTGAGILWLTQAPAHASFWGNLVGPFLLTGAVTWVFIPVSIGALVGVRERDAGIASGLIDSSQQLGGAIGIAVASTVAAARSHALLGQGHAVADALAGGFHGALWVCGLVGLTAVPVALLLVRRAETPQAGVAPTQRKAPASPGRPIAASVRVKPGGDDQPPMAGTGGDVGKRELHDVPSGRDDVMVDVAVHVPQQQLGVQILVADLTDPAGAPDAQRLDHRPELAPSQGQDVAHLTRVVLPFHDARPDELAQPLGQQRGDIRGTPRRTSLKCWLPVTSSRTMSSVHRSSNSSMALATGQNWR